jgi:hypothetical protein
MRNLFILVLFLAATATTATTAFNCTVDSIDCSGNGVCSITRDVCICDRKFATFPPWTPGVPSQCTYQRKSQLIAFVSNFFGAGVGAANWYLGNTDMALMQLFLGFGGVVSMCCFCFCLTNCRSMKSINLDTARNYDLSLTVGEEIDGPVENAANGALLCCMCLMFISTITMWALMIYHIRLGIVTDGNGVSMVKDMRI